MQNCTKNLKTYSVITFMLNILLVLNILFSEYIYSSYFTFVNWYESCGTQFLAIFIISLPIFLGLWILYYIISKKYNVKSIGSELSIISAIIFILPLLLDLSLSDTLITIGAIGGIITLFIALFKMGKDFKLLFK